ncbi:DUF1499 domain-containing protein [Salinarimonas chemoclinalis]|uniref:DUF1499 domain-containing protein n=1 Tax=Salinarimonas chemoclinalis TaxID=3241599 RepID=UPI003558B5ED
MRRLIVEDPMSRPATWSLRFGWLGLAVLLIAGLVVRARRVELEPGLAALAAACVVACLAALLALLAFVRIWREGHRGFGRAVGGLLLAVLTLVYPALLGVRGVAGPPMLDVTTRAAPPLTFSASRAASEARDGWRPAPTPAGLRERQRAAAPALAGLDVALPEDAAYALAREAADALGYAVLEAVAPGGRGPVARLEARTETLVLRFPVELTLRVSPTATGARVDARAVTRAPLADLGGARWRIERLLAEIDARASLL